MLSFGDDVSGSEQFTMPTLLPAGTTGDNPTRQAGRFRAPLVVALVLLVLLVLRLLQAGDSLLAPLDLAGSPGGPDAPGSQAMPVDLDAIRAAGLFSASGSTAQPALQASARQPATLPSTTDVRLEGIVLAADPANSVAFLRSGGRQQAYRVGDSLAEGALVLRDIARDHIVLERRGERLRLALHDPGTRQSTANNNDASGLLAGVAAALPRVNQADLEGALQTVNAAFDVGSLAEVMEVRPAQRNGRLIGYQLSPGVRLKEFVQLGLRTGDIVTAVNGIPLDDLGALQSLGSLMNGATEVSFSLLREGQVQTLRISLQALAASTRAPDTANNNMERP